jgi:hypothetical protein
MPDKSIKLKSKAKPIPNPLIVRFVVLFVFIVTFKIAISVPFNQMFSLTRFYQPIIFY